MPPLKLTDLEPAFLKVMASNMFQCEGVSLAEADGIEFLCPVCFERNDRKRPGVHAIICWQPGVDKKMEPGPGRWTIKGTSFEDLSLIAGSSSVHLTKAPCRAHFFVENGKIRMVGTNAESPKA